MWVLQASCGWLSRQLKNIRERKTSELIVELRGQSDEDKLKDKDKKSREPVEPLQVCGVWVANKQ